MSDQYLPDSNAKDWLKDSDLEQQRCELRAIRDRIDNILTPRGFEPRKEIVDGVIPAAHNDIVQKIRRVLKFRDLRKEVFGADIFADPAWDILLEIFVCELTQQRITISAACEAARVPPTTGLRWLNILIKKGLVRKVSDPLHGRRVFVSLTDLSFTNMRVLVESELFRSF